MKKKIFYRNSLYSMFILSFVLFMGLGLLYILLSLIFGFASKIYISPIFEGFVCVVGIILMSNEANKFLGNKIVLENENLFVPESRGKGREKIQYKVVVKYEEIAGIFMVESQKDSLNKNDCSGIPMPYIVIDLKNDKQYLINVFWYSKNTKKRILNEILTRARACGNDFTNETAEEIYAVFQKGKTPWF